MKNYKKKFILVMNGFSIFSLEKQKICGSGVVAKTVGFKGKQERVSDQLKEFLSNS